MELFKNNRWLLIPILSSLLLLVLMKTVLFLGYVPTESMEPTLKKDSFILGTRLYGDLTDGDIIIFERDGRLLVKRITASGGEAVVRNGITLIVPENCYYVQGDNANHSYDIAAKLVLVKMGGDKLSALCFFLQNTCAHICVLTVIVCTPDYLPLYSLVYRPLLLAFFIDRLPVRCSWRRRCYGPQRNPS